MYMHLKLVIWNWIVYQGSLLWKGMIPPSLSLCLGVGPLSVLACQLVLLLLSSCLDDCFCDFMDAVFLSLYCSRCSGLTLQPFCSLFWYDQKALDLGIVLYIRVSLCSVGFD